MTAIPTSERQLIDGVWQYVTAEDTGGGGGSQAVNVATKTLTNAEVLALPHPTPVEIVAAPGAGFALVPIHATLRLTWVADYTNIQATAGVGLKIGTNSALGPIHEDAPAGSVTNLLAGGEAASAFLPSLALGPSAANDPVLASSGLFDGDIANKAIFLTATNAASSDFTGGDAGNSLKVTLLYYVVTF